MCGHLQPSTNRIKSKCVVELPTLVGGNRQTHRMVSTFGWLDTDSEQRRKMLEVVGLFKEEGTVDELGIGSIRDAIANSLFPGTSVLHTRLRYVLFIPWLMQRAAARAVRRHGVAWLRIDLTLGRQPEP